MLINDLIINKSDVEVMNTLGMTLMAKFVNSKGIPFTKHFKNFDDFNEFKEQCNDVGTTLSSYVWVGYVIRKKYTNGNSYILVKGGWVATMSDKFICIEDTYSTRRIAKMVASRYKKGDVSYDKLGLACKGFTYDVVTVVNGKITTF